MQGRISMGDVPDIAYEQTYGAKTISECTLANDLSPTDLGYPADHELDLFFLTYKVPSTELTNYTVPRGNRLRKETYTECGFTRRLVYVEDEGYTPAEE